MYRCFTERECVTTGGLGGVMALLEMVGGDGGSREWQ